MSDNNKWYNSSGFTGSSDGQSSSPFSFYKKPQQAELQQQAKQTNIPKVEEQNQEEQKPVQEQAQPESQEKKVDVKAQNQEDDSKKSQSFADRYSSQKKSAYTSQTLESKASEEGGSIESNSSSSPKKVDPQKKMLANLIYLVKGVDDGRNAWYYVLVDRLKVNLFLKALNDDIIHLEKYGKILYSAYGDEPPKDVTDALKDEYGIDG